ncbi:riboflavin synthase [Cellvibrio japonicus]|uniref:Riboflavin synthase n=1 Tax=Cellvibrio japonicus (strain Ueda107) TaxID=498211 RepID=B3PBC9_CELJU|nr:riboflavin synthase [Cellvibrio japonicus]ACE85758.1 riboflavin synthase, alpha subunit [Cellvibrio japonicus Ueda107]QEI13055.1 riboflavin synthase [Cellvibrio japonicus]QEI16629.1 riboflavin synthase [Cellvibrio japonicus]QEI20207.1 riboflavin synthase [Cellvibrio japonicus]
MFTGIIEAIGEVVALQPQNGDLRLRIKTHHLNLADVHLGDSIATNGVCLTVVDLPGDGYWADVSRETLDNTTLPGWKLGQRVNLEKALTPQTRLGGHIVSGHVDGVGEVVKRFPDARSERFHIRAPKELAKYIAHKGSITVDGTSLTVNKVDGAVFELNIVPHTLQWTIMDTYQTGTNVNLEVDVLARYLERLMLGDKAAESSGQGGITLEFLTKNGFA